jgi:predicted protein tyrosine phosphatase
MRVLFICSRNRRRSPTAERTLAAWDGMEADSAGTAVDADVVVTAEHVLWAELIVVMEGRHRRALQNKLAKELRGKRVVCLDIRDDYQFMEPALVALVEQRMRTLLGMPA